MSDSLQRDIRLDELARWLTDTLGFESFDIAPASADASFRRYFRVKRGGVTFIVMDAPPSHENCRPFVAIARAFSDLGLHVPQILKQDLINGFLLLSDLGNTQYLSHLNASSVDSLYTDAINALIKLQTGSHAKISLPPYDHPLYMREMGLFRDWFVAQHLGVALNATQQNELEQAFQCLAQAALEQPCAWVHRDYHSRNLMVTAENNPGVLDFQDAVVGPMSYDLVSLLRDCYIAWPQSHVEEWVKYYLANAKRCGLLKGVELNQFMRWFDLMGIQRHLKAIGIFARLNIRDGKPGYLHDIPRTMAYVVEASRRLPEMAGLQRLLADVVLPSMGMQVAKS